MTDEEHYIKWRNENSKIDRHNITETSIGHKHIHWNNGVDRRKAYLDGLAQGRKESAKDIEVLTKENKLCEEIIIGEQQEINRLEKENAELKAQKERFKVLIAEMKEIRDTTTNEYVKCILTYLIKKYD